MSSSIFWLCVADEEDEPAFPPLGKVGTRLLRPYFGMHRFEWRSNDSVSFAVTHGDWIRLLRDSGLSLERLIEIQAPDGAPDALVPHEWGSRWPAEEIWVARKT